MKKALSVTLAPILLAAVLPALALAADNTLTLPAGTSLHVQLTTTLSTRTNQTGDPWSGKVLEPVFSEGREAVPAGSIVDGHITWVKEPGKVKGRGEMRLVADTITTPGEGGARYDISASLEDAQGAEGAKVEGQEGTIKGPSSRKGDAASVGIGAGVGAGVGAITAGGKGALYGAGIGAVVMGVRSLFKRGKDIILPQGTELTFMISRTVVAKQVTSSPEPASQ